MPLADGKWEDWVCLQHKPVAESLSKPSTSAAAEAGTPGKMSPDAVLRFRADCVEVLSAVVGHSLPLKQFPEQYTKVKKEPFLLANYQAKKILHLVQCIPDVVQVLINSALWYKRGSVQRMWRVALVV